METFFKKQVFRSKPYRKWVARQQSCISHNQAQCPHHIKRPGFGGSVKCSDLWVIPLTLEEHNEFHQIGWQTWEGKYNVDQRELAMQTVEKAKAEGIL